MSLETLHFYSTVPHRLQDNSSTSGESDICCLLSRRLERRTFNYFWELADSNNYQIPDRYPTLTFSSIAATGFGLSAYIVGVEKHYVTREEAAQRTLNTLKVLWNLPQGPGKENLSGYRGLFYHFLTLDKATRYKNVELSTIDSGLLMAGVLSSMSYFDGDNETEKAIRAGGFFV